MNKKVVNFDKKNLNSSINLINYGVVCLKICKKGMFSHKILLFIHEENEGILQYLSNKKKFHESRIELNDIKFIREEPLFKLTQKYKNKCLLCINHINSKNFVLFFESELKRNLFWQGLQYFIDKSKQIQNG